MTDRRIDRRRRALLGSGLCAILAPALLARAAPPPVNAHGGAVVPPVAVPDLVVTLSDGRASSLRRLLVGRATAVQLIYTGCTTTCPMQGAIFQRAQRLMPARAPADAQLLSLAINPDEDTPRALRDWLAQFGAGPEWVAATPRAEDLDRVAAFFGSGRDGLTTHATEVGIVDRQGRLVWRTSELPAPESIASLLARVERDA